VTFHFANDHELIVRESAQQIVDMAKRASVKVID
jgi:hypothetical protein